MRPDTSISLTARLIRALARDTPPFVPEPSNALSQPQYTFLQRLWSALTRNSGPFTTAALTDAFTVYNSPTEESPNTAEPAVDKDQGKASPSSRDGESDVDRLLGLLHERRLRKSQPPLIPLHFTGANLTVANLVDADLTSADLTGADLTGADLTLANLTSADLTGADLTGADLTGADLTLANLTDANLTDADLTHANFIRAKLARANLIRAKLARANLIRANLIRADLTSADLTLAKLTFADLPGVRWSHSTLWPNDKFIQALRAYSEEIAPGVWQVRGADGPDRSPTPANM